jgi:hypothetical protein
MKGHAEDGGPCYDHSKVLEAVTSISNDKETLRCLYAEYSERMRNRGAHVWITGAVFIPLSFAGIVAGIDNPWQTTLIAVLSIFLIWIWTYASKSMRVALERHRTVCGILESAMLKQEFSPEGITLSDLLEPLHEKTWPKLRSVRLGITWFVTGMWVAAMIISFVTQSP